MAVKTYRPTTPSQRQKAVVHMKTVRPERKLTRAMRKKAGRNVTGRITSWHRGGGNKRRYRLVDFKRDKDGVPGRVARIEYDPNRSAHIALIFYADGDKRYILAPDGLGVDSKIMSGADAEVSPGNVLPLRSIPAGTMIHNVELRAGKGGQMVRSAGTAAQLMAKEGVHAHIRLPSGEVRLVRLECRATIGQVGNVEHSRAVAGKAGWSRWRGRRPHVRGVAMNPVDHPLGGGEGKSSGGRHPTTPWGKPTKGYRTRKGRLASDRMIVRRRAKK